MIVQVYLFLSFLLFFVNSNCNVCKQETMASVTCTHHLKTHVSKLG